MVQHNWSQIQAIIFDMDGTLVDTERLWKKSEKDLLANHNRQYDEIIHAPFLGLETGELIASIRRAYDLEAIDQDDLEEELHVRVEAYLKTETIPQPGAVDLVNHVLRNKFPTAIATNSSRRIVDATLAEQRWTDAIRIRCCADDVKQGKPAPDLYLLAAQSVGIAPENCIAIEDSLNGSRAAIAAGMICLSIPQHDLSSIAHFSAVTPFVFDGMHAVHQFLIEKGILVEE